MSKVYKHFDKDILKEELQTFIDVVAFKDSEWETFFDWNSYDVVAFSIDNESNCISQIIINPKAKDIENLFEYSTDFDNEKIIITDYEHFEKDYSCYQTTDTLYYGYHGDYSFSSCDNNNIEIVFRNQKACDEKIKEWEKQRKLYEKHKHFEEFMTLDEYENVRKHFGVKKYVHKD